MAFVAKLSGQDGTRKRWNQSFSRAMGFLAGNDGISDICSIRKASCGLQWSKRLGFAMVHIRLDNASFSKFVGDNYFLQNSYKQY